MSFSPAIAAFNLLIGSQAAAPGTGVPSLLAPPSPSGPTAAPAAAAPKYDLRRAKDGSGDLVYESKPFTARVAVDGTVSFKDHRVTDFTWRPPWLPVQVRTGVPSLADTLASLASRRKVPRVEDVGPPDESFLVIPKVTPYRPDPREGGGGGALPPLIVAGSAMGKFDLTEDLMRFSGADPYRIEKARFLAATRDARIRMAVQAHAQRLRQASADLVPTLNAIADDDRRSPGERRAVLEALRDEMDPATPEGRAAAATITDFLARRFPAPP